MCIFGGKFQNLSKYAKFPFFLNMEKMHIFGVKFQNMSEYGKNWHFRRKFVKFVRAKKLNLKFLAKISKFFLLKITKFEIFAKNFEILSKNSNFCPKVHILGKKFNFCLDIRTYAHTHIHTPRPITVGGDFQSPP